MMKMTIHRHGCLANDDVCKPSFVTRTSLDYVAYMQYIYFLTIKKLKVYSSIYKAEMILHCDTRNCITQII